MRKDTRRGGINLVFRVFTIVALIFFVCGQAYAADAVVTDQKAAAATTTTDAAAAAVAGTGEGSAAALVAPAVALGITAGTIVVVPIATSVMEGGKTTTTHK